jgi:hypothetical protein
MSDLLHLAVDVAGVVTWLAVLGGVARYFWHVLAHDHTTDQRDTVVRIPGEALSGAVLAVGTFDDSRPIRIEFDHIDFETWAVDFRVRQ